MSDTTQQNEVFETPDQETSFQPYIRVPSSYVHAFERDIAYPGRYQDDTKGYLDKVTIIFLCSIHGITMLYCITYTGKCRNRRKCGCTGSSL